MLSLRFHPFLSVLTFIVCLGKGLRNREELWLGMLPPATEQSWISWLRGLQSPETLPTRDQVTSVITGHPIPDSSIEVGTGYGSIYPRNRNSHWKAAWLVTRWGKGKAKPGKHTGYIAPSSFATFWIGNESTGPSNGEVSLSFFFFPLNCSFLPCTWNRGTQSIWSERSPTHLEKDAELSITELTHFLTKGGPSFSGCVWGDQLRAECWTHRAHRPEPSGVLTPVGSLTWAWPLTVFSLCFSIG